VAGNPTRGEIRTGFIPGKDGQPVEITYEVQNGKAIWQGDIILGPAHAIFATREELLRSAASGTPRIPGLSLAVISDGTGKSARWPGGIVPYEIEGTLASDAQSLLYIHRAIERVETSTAGVRLVPRAGEDDYVRFIPSDDCRSHVGRAGGEQHIEVGKNCDVGTTTHEILHALGIWHEHSRCDRDDFVEILWENIIEAEKHNFDKHCDLAQDLFEYEEGSIMHYGPFDFTKTKGQATIRSLRGLEKSMGNRSALSVTDVRSVNHMYGATNQAPTAIIAKLADSYPEGASVLLDGRGSSDPDDAVLWYAWNTGARCFPSSCLPGRSWEDIETSFPDDGVYTVKLRVTDGAPQSDGSLLEYFKESEATAAVPVVNVAPTVEIVADPTLISGQSLAVQGRFFDPGLNDAPWAWVLEWGDGLKATGSTNEQEPPISASRRFCSAGTYRMILSVTDKDSGTGADSMSLSVAYLAVPVEIKLGSDKDPVSLRSKGVLPVVVLSTPTFDATKVDLSSIVLGDENGADTPVAQKTNGNFHVSIEDVNRDGRPDLSLKFEIADLVANGDLSAGTSSLALRGVLSDGCTNIRGSDLVTIVP
jgi:hypothetical protein